jgi:hypothetical protein
MHEEILAAVLGGDEAISLGIVEPLDGTGCHVISSLVILDVEQVEEGWKALPVLVLITGTR